MYSTTEFRAHLAQALNKETQTVLDNADNGKDLHHAKNIDDLFNQLGI